MNDLVGLLPLLLIVPVFYLLVLRPARARQRDFQETQKALSVGERVMLASGIFGEVADLDDDVVHLRIAPDTVIEVKRQAVALVVPDPTSPEDEN
ncbi:preprotein translocase subunit YajC [Aeromicrobium sp. Root495]|uniref:preprotein translocase subunit YajC n=1 Tax=Aeromicrobium sp. Root495 TaxID=1736550 RepID=UPI000A47242C|nr:preprotein translocase subunit YajC [Aeromicrobium sp. Root495]